MKNLLQKTKFNHDKLKTLCTLDTSDVVLSSDFKELIDRNKHSQTLKQRKNSKSKQNNRHQLSISFQKKQKNFSNDKYQNTILQTRTINTQTKPKKQLSKSRSHIKTEYNQLSPRKMLLNNLQIFNTVKNVKFHMDEQYNVDPFYVINTIKASKQQTVHTVKYLDRTKKSVYYTLRKSNYPKTVQKYERELLMKQQLTDLLKPNERKNLSCIYKTYRRDKQDNMFVVYHMEGQPLTWKKSLSKKLIHNLQKNNMEILRHLIVELSKAVHILSTHGFYHSEIRLKNVLVQLKEDDQNVKVSKLVKLANLSKCLKIKDKKSFQSLSHSIYTPPEILNFIIFQNEGKNFNRSWLEYIYKYQHAWRINVWSLGVLILELLNQEPITNTFLEITQIIDFQKHVQLKCAYLFDKITDQNFEKLLKKMLSTNPQQRPSPEQIILCLTS